MAPRNQARAFALASGLAVVLFFQGVDGLFATGEEDEPVAGVIGACCIKDGSCFDLSQASCDDAGGVYQGDGTDCSTAACTPPPIGACCFSDGSCQEVTLGACGGTGIYQGDGTSCSTTTCPLEPIGACCSPEGTCTEGTLAECGSLNGTYQGDASTCGAVTCPITAVELESFSVDGSEP